MHTPGQMPVLSHTLTPAQQTATGSLLDAMACGNVVVLQGDVGRGKTTVLKRVQANLEERSWGCGNSCGFWRHMIPSRSKKLGFA